MRADVRMSLGGSAGDPQEFRGIRHSFASVRPTFWGDPSAGTELFYNIKKVSEGCICKEMYGCSRNVRAHVVAFSPSRCRPPSEF